MKWLDQIERRFQGVTIPQFPLFIVAANGMIFLLSLFDPDFVMRLTLSPRAIMAGEWWRALTFLFVPPAMNPISLVFWLLLTYLSAQGLENAWGEFRFFFFYILGGAATLLAALFILGLPLSNGWLNITLLLAFATLFPDFELMVFPLPISFKIRYLAWLLWALMAAAFVFGSLHMKVAIAASLVNYFVFFGAQLWNGARLKWEVYKNRRRMRM